MYKLLVVAALALGGTAFADDHGKKAHGHDAAKAAPTAPAATATTATTAKATSMTAEQAKKACEAEKATDMKKCIEGKTTHM